MTYHNLLLLLSSVLMITACQSEPVIKVTEQSREQQSITFKIEVEHAGMDAVVPEIEVFSRYNASEKIAPEHTRLEKIDNTYLLTIDNLEEEQYRLNLNFNYPDSFLGISTGTTTKSTFLYFSINKPIAYHCFRFNNSDDKLEGWQASRVYIDNRTEPVSPPSCPGLFNVNQGSGTVSDTQQGSLFVPISNDCFPGPESMQSLDQYWQFSFTSPTLINNKDWQNIKGYQFRMRTEEIPVIVKPGLGYKNGGENVISGKPYSLTPGKWHIITLELDNPVDGKIESLSINVSGLPEQTVLKKVDSVLLDAVCPVYE